MKKKTLAILLASSMILGASSSVVASGALKKIDAYIVSNQKITVDGSSVKTNNPVLTYNNTRYVSVRDISKLVGADIAYKNGTIQLQTPQTNSSNDINQPSNNSSTNSTNNSQSSTTEPSTVKDKVVKIGESVVSGNFKYTVSDFKTTTTPDSDGLYDYSYIIHIETLNNYSYSDKELSLRTFLGSQKQDYYATGLSFDNMIFYGKTQIPVEFKSGASATGNNQHSIDRIIINANATNDKSGINNVQWTIN